jgi:hypothetical protein
MTDNEQVENESVSIHKKHVFLYCERWILIHNNDSSNYLHIAMSVTV